MKIEKHILGVSDWTVVCTIGMEGEKPICMMFSKICRLRKPKVKEPTGKKMVEQSKWLSRAI